MPKHTVKTKMDERGRVVIPKEIRERFQAELFEVKVEGNKISLVPLTDPLTTLQKKLSKSSTKSIDELAENIAVKEVKNANH
ncbi:MAG: AbrB/MazE/SpoVT family DNA-binding domain-containing protein [Candidatus Korarchaeota archaeon]|nr:AbrB/MazE/SpoVT family DNA-binding domain-containing protein [Candidatus Korarchaeota archaeon]